MPAGGNPRRVAAGLRQQISLQKRRTNAYWLFAALGAATFLAAFVVAWIPIWVQVLSLPFAGFNLFGAWADHTIRRRLEQQMSALGDGPGTGR